MKQMVRRSAKWALVVTLIVGGIVQFTPAYAVLSLYDDFNDPSHVVRGDLWKSADNINYTGGVGSGRTDAIRIIDALIFPTANPKLLIAERFVLQPGGTAGNDLNGLTARGVSQPVSVQADVNMLLCTLNQPGLISAGVQLYAYNDGTSPAAGNSIGDILTRLRLGCTSTNQPVISWLVLRCTDADCGTTSTLGTGTFNAVSLGQEVTLRVSRSGSSLVFTAAGQTQTFPLPGNPTAPPRLPSNGLRVRVEPTTPAPGGEFTVGATFDNVMMDP